MLFEQNTLPEGPMAAAWAFLESRKSLTERVVDIVPISWFIAETNFSAHYTKRKDYEGFDEVISGLLLTGSGCDSVELRAALGLDEELGDKVLNAMIQPLKGTMIEGDPSIWYLTERGQSYAREGRKFVRNACKFTLATDLQDQQGREAHLLKSAIAEWWVTGPEITNAAAIMDSLRSSWAKTDKVLEWATVQAPNYHQPSKGFYIEEPKPVDIHILQATVWVGVLEDFQQQVSHLHAFNPADGKEVAAISTILNNPSSEKVRERVWAALRKKNESQIVATTVPAQQVEDEKWAMEQAKALESMKAEERAHATAALLSERKSFDTMEFEQELERVSQKCKGEWWLISPWIRAAAWAKRRRQLERALANGASVFLGYSEPHNPGDEMLPNEVKREIQSLQDRHPKLFVAQLPQFHEKIMYAEVEGQQFEYTGSFNLLSFAAGSQGKIGRENMRRLRWGDDSTANRQRHLDGFVNHYAGKWTPAIQELAATDYADRKRILDADRKLSEIVKAHAPFATLVGGEYKARFEAGCASEKERMGYALLQWHRRELDAEIAGLKAQTNLSSSVAESKLRSALDRLKTDKIPESQFSSELQSLRSALDNLAFNSEIQNWEKELDSHPTTITESEIKRIRQKLDQLRTRFPHAHQDSLSQAIHAADAKLKAKLPEVGLKVVGKIDLPPQPNHKKKKKKK